MSGITIGRVALVSVVLAGVLSAPAAALVAPTNTTPPTVSGTAQQGQTLTLTQGTWTGDPTPTVTDQWQRCDTAGATCADIPGATGLTYMLAAEDVGHTIRVLETATNGTGSPSPVQSDPTAAVAPAGVAPANTAPPAVNGNAQQGATLTLTQGTWTGTPTPTVADQWQRCDSSGANCTNIAGATGSIYVLVADDVGHTIRVLETATNDSGHATAQSPATAVVTAAPVTPAAPANTVPPAVTGTTVRDATLTVTQGQWTGNPAPTLTEQWQRCDTSGANCTNIVGATGTTYVLTAADVDHTIRVLETATNASGSASQPSAVTGVVTTGMFLTVVARQCPTYTDITANRARNNIMESLQDLGVDTPYSAGQPLDPITEARVQPNCTPIVGWKFTLGTGYTSRAVSGPWGSLSIVTGAYDTSLVTQASVPLLDVQARPLPGQTIAGATTIELTPAQAARAASSSSLWIQGGTTTDPILNTQFPSLYGFGALRCAIDNLNGDNVEWISYPSSYKHVFCFAYYVTPAPTAGTIVVTKKVAGGTTGDTFNFGGNVSYNPGGAFTLAATPTSPGSTSYIRGQTREGEAPWTVKEIAGGGWSLVALTCTSSSGKSTTTTDVASGQAQIRLAAGDKVTCTFTDSKQAPPPQLLISLSVTCVANHGATYDAAFSYNNPNTATVAIPLGPNNSVTPSGLGGGQPPESFLPGAHAGFTMTGISSDASVTWAIRQSDQLSNSVTSTAETCPPPEPPTPPEVKPIALSVSCVTNHDTTFDAVFVWQNPNASDVSIPIGADTNSVSPGGPDRGQPSTFAADASAEFTLTGVPNAATAGWTLTQTGVSSSAEATSTFATKCPEQPPPPPEVKPIALSVSCVTNHDTTFDAVFVWQNPNASDVSIPVGADTNSVSPGGPDRGQPSTFAADASAEFTLTGVPNAETAGWTLTQTGVSSSAETTSTFATKCPEQPQPPTPPTPELRPVESRVTCVANHDGTYDAIFAYLNPNADAVVVPIGPNNTVSPGGPDRGQPTRFEQGEVRAAFTVAGIPQSDSVSWTLAQGAYSTTATATASFPTKCVEPPGPPPQPPEPPPTEPPTTPPPSTSGLEIRKVTLGGVGRFQFTIRPVAGGQTVNATATTLKQGVAETAAPGTLVLAPGQYEIDEKTPPRPGSHWSVSAVRCGDSDLPAQLPARVTLTAGAGIVCTVSNTLVHAGSIVLYKISLGGIGRAGFVVTRGADETTRYLQRVTTVRPAVRQRARGDDTSRLALGAYVVQETDASPGRALGAVLCNGKLVPFSASRVLVHLTVKSPHAECVFVNVKVPNPDPKPKPPPPPDPVDPSTDIRITKTVDRRQIRLGDVLTYTMHVKNLGKATADLVVVRDQLNLPAAFVDARPSSGRCIQRLPLNCVIRSIDPGKSATIVVRVRPLRTGTLSNSVVTGLANVDPRLGNNEDDVKTRVLEAHRHRVVKPPFTG